MTKKKIENIVAGIFIALLTIIGILVLSWIIVFLFNGLVSVYHTMF